MQTRRGRTGEWANCFQMLCRAMGARVRFVWTPDNYIWTEIYSEFQKRWVHVDACEESWDNPRLYAEGWAKKMAYCIAFSVDEATDVTRRYIRKPEEALSRTQCSEEALLSIIRTIRVFRQSHMSKEEVSRVKADEAREEKELQVYSISALVEGITGIVPDSRSSDHPSSTKISATPEEMTTNPATSP